ncbi:hypothetical protein TWF281_000281 [Arthrobotrys megalospora]
MHFSSALVAVSSIPAYGTMMLVLRNSDVGAGLGPGLGPDPVFPLLCVKKPIEARCYGTVGLQKFQNNEFHGTREEKLSCLDCTGAFGGCQIYCATDNTKNFPEWKNYPKPGWYQPSCYKKKSSKPTEYNPKSYSPSQYNFYS